jgi:hypothetical protein
MVDDLFPDARDRSADRSFPTAVIIRWQKLMRNPAHRFLELRHFATTRPYYTQHRLAAMGDIPPVAERLAAEVRRRLDAYLALAASGSIEEFRRAERLALASLQDVASLRSSILGERAVERWLGNHEPFDWEYGPLERAPFMRRRNNISREKP